MLNCYSTELVFAFYFINSFGSLSELNWSVLLPADRNLLCFICSKSWHCYLFLELDAFFLVISMHKIQATSLAPLEAEKGFSLSS